MSAFLVMLREGVEAAIIVAVLLAYLDRLSERRQARWVWAGTISAGLVSLAVGVVLWNTIGELEGDAEALAEGVVALAAAGLLTWMIFWMASHARHLKGKLQSRVDVALAVGGTGALAAVAFVAVVREGIESALFMISTTVGTSSSIGEVVGGVFGLIGAIGIGYLFYIGSHRIDLRVFFRITGVLIVLFAAGLVSKGVHEFQEIGLLPTFIEHVWDMGILDPSTTTAGRFLAGLFGWTPNPSLLMVFAYLAYLVPVGAVFLRITAGAPTAERRASAPAA